MGGVANSSAPEPLSPGKWITQIILAVILGEAIWGFLVSLTNGLIVPALARVAGGDPQSPVYLGNGSFQLTGIFVSVLELCLAGIVAILLNQWSQSGSVRVRVKTVKVKTVKGTMPSIAPSTSAAPPTSVPKPVAFTPEPPAVAAAAAVTAQPPPVVAPSAPVAAPQLAPSAPKSPAAVPKPPAPAKPEKPKKPHEVYYNIVGEPINPTEDDQ